MRGSPLALLPLLVVLAGAAGARPHQPAPPTGERVIDLAMPVIDATLAGVTLRLKVALDARDTVELNPAAAARLPLGLEEGGAVEVGRVTLPGRQAWADGTIDGRAVRLVVSTHGRDCCAGVDGMIGAEQLPYARVRFVRTGAPAGTVRRFPARVSEQAGLAGTATLPTGEVAVKLAPDATETVATASAGAILAAASGGRWDGPTARAALAFGVERPVRAMRLARPVMLLGLPVARMLVRVGDFRGGRALPDDPAAAADIVVKGRTRPSQHDWPAVTLGRAELDRCSAITFDRGPEPTLELACAWP